MSKAEVSDELISFIKQNLLDAKIDLNQHTELQNIPGIDSMAMVEIILFIERKFDVCFSDEELNPGIFHSVDILAQAVINHA